MVRFRVEGGLQRLLHKTSRTRGPGRFRSKKKGRVLTPLQKAQLRLEREERKIALNQAVEDARNAVWEAAKQMHEKFQTHTSEYFYRLVLQSSRVASGKRRTSRWNAFVSKEMRRRNAELSEGNERNRVSDGEVLREIAATWKTMSEEEQIAATEEVLKELSERHEDQKKGAHTVPLQAFHDARATIATIQRELEDMHARTGVEALLFVARSETSSFVQPYAFHTSTRLAEFVHAATQSTMSDFALKMEGYCVAGLQGIATNYIQGLLNLKKQAASLIMSKLQEASTRGPITRMYYVNFDKFITERYGIVLENWPLAKFRAPGDICSRPELDILIASWTSGATRFRSIFSSSPRGARTRSVFVQSFRGA
ncbi:hypothetical protein NUW54_g11965 [Trametes sanguinea]|uniref:Uncharacterized protein n=1 Tax=Trametes sanguinea TaxID=158606 RepID=A0ACC1N3Z0_9APHY|nr:hypothetical protein NUW54_g11965 [Trametes sanguinea]